MIRFWDLEVFLFSMAIILISFKKFFLELLYRLIVYVPKSIPNAFAIKYWSSQTNFYIKIHLTLYHCYGKLTRLDSYNLLSDDTIPNLP